MSNRRSRAHRIQIVPHWLDEPNAGLFATAIVAMAKQRRKEATQSQDQGAGRKEVDRDLS
jgi:hypothetical protein